MRAVSVSRKVSSTKNLVKFCHFLQAGKTLFSVVSYYLKVVESAVRTYTTRGGQFTHTEIAKYLVHLYFISEKSTKVRKIVLLWKNFLLFQKNKMSLGRKPQNIHHFLQRQPVQFSIKIHTSFLYEGPHS